MTIDEVITGYLAEKGRMIIVPGFGAFIRREEGGTVFIELLSTDDGALRNEVTRRLGCSSGEAAAAVERYVEQMKRQLASGETVEINGLGSVKTGANGKYVFTPGELGTPATASAETTGKSGEGDLRAKEVPEPAEPVKQKDSATGKDPDEANVRTARTEAVTSPAAAQTVKKSEESAAIGVEREGRSGPAGQAEKETLRNLENPEPSPRQAGGIPAHGVSYEPGSDAESIPAAEPLRESGKGAGNDPVAANKQQSYMRTAPVKPIPVDYSPTINIRQRNTKKRMDSVMLIAIIAIAIAIVVIAYGRIVEKNYSVDLNDVMTVDEAGR